MKNVCLIVALLCVLSLVKSQDLTGKYFYPVALVFQIIPEAQILMVQLSIILIPMNTFQ